MFHYGKCCKLPKSKVCFKSSTSLKNLDQPSSRSKIFLPNPNKIRPKRKQSIVVPRVNQLGIQMLSKSIHEQVFKEASREVACDPFILEQCKLNLKKHNMNSKESDYMPDVDFRIPPMQGNNLIEHFQIIAETQVKPYVELMTVLLENLPQMPQNFVMQKGWTRYEHGREPQIVSHPLEEALVFDIEVCVKSGKAPTLATAVSNKAWYGWVSSSLIEGSGKPVTLLHYDVEDLIPLESCVEDSGAKLTDYMKKPKVIVGHNVSYDRARIKEQYWLNRTGTRFVDTMSMHISVSGVTSYQRILLKSDKTDLEDESWKNISSLNNLADVYNLYCGQKISKTTRDVFVEGSLKDIKDDFQNVMYYCANDVVATYKVLRKLLPMFLERFPHPATLAGMLELGMAYLPVNNNWNSYVADCEQTYEDLDIERKVCLVRRADQACQLLHNDKYKEDLWMWDEDWEVKPLKINKTITLKNKKVNSDSSETVVLQLCEDEEPDPLEEKFRYLWDTKQYLSKVRTPLPGYPSWYRKLCTKPDSNSQWVPGPQLISTSMKVTPKLLCLTWEGYPLHYLREKGWGFLVPFTDDVEIDRKLPLERLLKKCPIPTGKPKENDASEAFAKISQTVQENLTRKEFYSKAKSDNTGGLYRGTGIWCKTEIEDCCWFFKLPHKNGESFNVGNPLSRDFLNKFSEHVLAGDAAGAEHVLTIARMLSYWSNNRDRIMQQMVVWLDAKDLPKSLRDDNIYGAILPQVVVAGTLTRRAVERTWMTASNAHPERVGSELRAMIQAPPGYRFVGADVDSQELWIASVLGDADYAKLHGATPFGWMTLSGSKADGTDMHSVTAKAVGISRDHAKVINYARIYGAGQNFAERLLKQFNPSMSEADAKSKAAKMFGLTKGKRIYHLNKENQLELPDQAYTRWQAFDVAKSFGKTVEELFIKPKWIGGTESAMFNRLEQIANSPSPVTPFLNSRLSRSIEPKSMSGDQFLPTRVNWVVQSGAVDFLHLMLVCMRWLMDDKVRFCLSFHDELRYLVPDEHKYKAALAMHVTNLLTRSFCSMKLGLDDLPQSVAFFSSVEVDSALRKDAKNDCVTPSNPHGLCKGYGIPSGESLDIFDAIQKAGGCYKAWYEMERYRISVHPIII